MTDLEHLKEDAIWKRFLDTFIEMIENEGAIWQQPSDAYYWEHDAKTHYVLFTNCNGALGGMRLKGDMATYVNGDKMETIIKKGDANRKVLSVKMANILR